MALTGYKFRSREHVEPYLEFAGQGPTYRLARQLSLRFQCVTIIGYPEKVYDSDIQDEPIGLNVNPLAQRKQHIHANEPSSERSAGNFRIYNSCQVISSRGELLHNYRKSHLCNIDAQWGASPSLQGFTSFELAIPRLKRSFTTIIGLSTDLIPWEANKQLIREYKFLDAVLRHKSRLVIIPLVWVNSKNDLDWDLDEWDDFTAIFKSIRKVAPTIDKDVDNTKKTLSTMHVY